jgi:hypothetical protein
MDNAAAFEAGRPLLYFRPVAGDAVFGLPDPD